MTREEFCSKLFEIRKQSGLQIRDVCASTNWLPQNIYRIEKGKNNFKISVLYTYFKALGKSIQINNGSRLCVINHESDLTSVFVDTRHNRSISQRKLAEMIGMSYVSIANLEKSKQPYTIDSVLSICEALGLSIEIVNKYSDHEKRRVL